MTFQGKPFKKCDFKKWRFFLYFRIQNDDHKLQRKIIIQNKSRFALFITRKIILFKFQSTSCLQTIATVPKNTSAALFHAHVKKRAPTAVLCFIRILHPINHVHKITAVVRIFHHVQNVHHILLVTIVYVGVDHVGPTLEHITRGGLGKDEKDTEWDVELELHPGCLLNSWTRLRLQLVKIASDFYTFLSIYEIKYLV